MTGTQNPQTGAFEAAADHPVATAVLVVVALAIGAGIGYLAASTTSTGDEAPIRVRDGSMYFEILNASTKWKKGSDDWHLDHGTRGKEDLDVEIAPKFSDSCSQALVTTKHFFVEYDNGVTVEIQATGNHLKLKLDHLDDLKPTNGDHTLTYGEDGKGYIKFLYKDNKNTTPVCTFSEAKRLTWLAVHDY